MWSVSSSHELLEGSTGRDGIAGIFRTDLWITTHLSFCSMSGGGFRWWVWAECLVCVPAFPVQRSVSDLASFVIR